MKTCPQCHTEYDDSRKFCRHDGAPLETRKVESETAKASNLTCSQCGNLVEAGKKFCRHCGAQLAPKLASKTGRPQQVAEEPTQVTAAPRMPTRIERLEQQLAAEPAQVSVLVELAEEYLRGGEARRAVELLEKALAQKSEDIRLHILLGQAWEAAGDYARALDAYLAGLAKDAWHPGVETVLFREDLLLKTYPRSVDELARIATSRGSVQMWRLLAQVSEAKGDHDKAVAFLTEAIRVKSDDLTVLDSLAQLCENLQRTEEAKKWHQRILTGNPAARASNLFFAQSHYAQGEYEDAIPYFERLLAGERSNRAYQLYWLLSNVKGYGLQGYENGITEVLRWQSLTEEEKPLARELFVLVGKANLQKGDLPGAEQYLLRAHHIAASQAIADMLATVEEGKGEEARRKGDLLQALVSYQQAAEYNPNNQAYAQKVTQLISLRTEENRRKRQAIQRKVVQGISLGLAAALLMVGTVYGYRTVRAWFQPPSPEQKLAAVDKELASLPEGGHTSLSSTQTAGGPETTGEAEVKAGVSSFVAGSPERQSQSSEEEKSRVSVQESEQLAKVSEPPKEEPRGKVVTARELGINVSGKGSADPNRSPEVIQQEIETHFPDLQGVYEAERTADPSLMGSLVLNLTIEPDGSTSQVRLQSAKIASKKLQDIVHGLAHEWHFSPASGEVSVEYPLLFLPSGMDVTSIIAWERSIAALDAKQESLQQAPVESQYVAKPAPKAQKPRVPLGVYRVTTSTPLRGEPRADAYVVTQLRPGIKVRVVRAAGDYLEVQSRKGKPPGYVHQKDVTFVSNR